MDVPTSDLNIVRSDHKVCTSDGAVWDESRSVPALEQILLSDKTFRANYSGKSPSCTMPLLFAAMGAHCFFTGCRRKGVTRTSVLPMTESGPGSGGAQIHQSCTVFTGETSYVKAKVFTSYWINRARTVSILTLRRLIVACCTVVVA